MLSIRWITLPLGLTALLGGCAFEAGHGFATITEATVRAGFEPGPARDTGNGVLTDNGYNVQVDQLLLGLGRIQLEQLRADGTAAFDPAAPPAGYSLCHGGHCHSDSGDLVSYEEIQAELAGGSLEVTSLAALPVEGEIDLLGGAPYTIEVRAIEPSAELPQGSIDRVSIEVTRLAATARFTGGRDAFALDQETTISLDLALGENLAVTAGRPLDRSEPREIQLGLDLTLDGTFFDGLDLVTLTEQGLLSGTDPASEPGRTLLRALLAASLEVSFTQ
jgi:hypothetical protein